MSFWKNLGKKVLSTATGGLYNPSSGGKAPSFPGEKKQHKEVVGKTKQAGGAQINYNAEEMVDDVAAPKATSSSLTTKQEAIKRLSSWDALQAQAQGTGWRSQAARSLLNFSSKLGIGGSSTLNSKQGYTK